jgi:hypothetical protein
VHDFILHAPPAHPARLPPHRTRPCAHRTPPVPTCDCALRVEDSAEKAEALVKFGNALLRKSPLPDVVVHLDVSAEACLARSNTPELSLEEIVEIRSHVDAAVRSMVERGCEVYRRRWDAFGSVNSVRDLILCASPTAGTERLRATPSAAAVERLLSDAWAASQPARPRARSRSASGGEDAAPSRRDEAAPLEPPASPAASTTTCPLGRAAVSPKAVSPTSIFSSPGDETVVPP